MSRVRVAVVGGGRSGEHEVSLASAAAAASALDPVRFHVLCLTIGRDGRWAGPDGPLDRDVPRSLAAAVGLLSGCDVVLPAVHGRAGEDGTLAALCELARIPYVGADVRGGAVAMDKAVTKLIAADIGIPTAAATLVTRSDRPELRWGEPAVVKPVSAGSSNGVTLVLDPALLPAALDVAFDHDDRVLVEEVVVGREVDMAVLEHPGGRRQVSPPLEIVGDGIFDSTRKYDGTADLVVPADLGAEVVARLGRAALALFDALGCRDLARFDFFLTSAGPVLNEVNTMPGLTPASQVPRMFAAAGMSYPRLLETLLTGARTRGAYAGPGPGGSGRITQDRPAFIRGTP